MLLCHHIFCIYFHFSFSFLSIFLFIHFFLHKCNIHSLRTLRNFAFIFSISFSLYLVRWLLGVIELDSCYWTWGRWTKANFMTCSNTLQFNHSYQLLKHLFIQYLTSWFQNKLNLSHLLHKKPIANIPKVHIDTYLAQYLAMDVDFFHDTSYHYIITVVVCYKCSRHYSLPVWHKKRLYL